MNKIWLLVAMLVFLPKPADAQILKVPLSKLSPENTVDIRCVSGEHTVTIAVPERWDVKNAYLDFSYVNSSGLLRNMSRIVIRLNGQPLRQINLDPVITEGKARVSLPGKLLEPGYNELSFTVSQHYALKCELPCAEDLWTTLKLDEAFIEIEYTLKPVPLKLSSIVDFLFDPRIYPNGEVNIITEDLSDDMMSNAGIAASGAARRFDYRKVLFSISSEVKPGVDNILIGTGEYVRSYLQGRGVSIDEVKGPLLKIVHLPSKGDAKDVNHALLILSGLDSKQIKLAAETMAIMSFPYPDSQEITPLEFMLPEIPQYGGRQMLTADKVYNFKELKAAGKPFRGINPTPRKVTFRLPADFHVKQNMYADLSLHFTYGAGMRSDSVLHISVNGREVRAIPLDDQSGAVIEGYKLSIPTYLFRAGTNTISISPVLTPSITRDCELIQTENLFLTLLEASTLYFPPMPHLVKLPRLDLFVMNGFPFTRWPDGYESEIFVTGTDPDTLASALNIVGMITQKNGYPLFAVRISSGKPVATNAEIMVIGDVSSIPEDLILKAPLRLAGETMVPYPVVRSWEGEEFMAFSRQKGGLADGRGIMTAFQSPYREGRTVLMLTAASPDELLRFSSSLLEPSVQAMVKGDVVFVDFAAPDHRVYSLDVGKKFFTGKSGEISKLNFYLHSYPYLYHISLVVAVLLLGMVVFVILRRYRKKRLGGEEGEEK